MIDTIIISTPTITSMNNTLHRRPPPPPNNNVFKISDADGDGLVLGTELENLVEGIEGVTGDAFSTDEALSDFDADQDGALSGEELFNLLTDNGFVPPLQMDNPENRQAGSQPPPYIGNAFASYAMNSGDDLIQQLIHRLVESGVNEENIGGIDVIS